MFFKAFTNLERGRGYAAPMGSKFGEYMRWPDREGDGLVRLRGRMGGKVVQGPNGLPWQHQQQFSQRGETYGDRQSCASKAEEERKKYMFPQLGFWSLLSAHWWNNVLQHVFSLVLSFSNWGCRLEVESKILKWRKLLKFNAGSTRWREAANTSIASWICHPSNSLKTRGISIAILGAVCLRISQILDRSEIWGGQ